MWPPLDARLGLKAATVAASSSTAAPTAPVPEAETPDAPEAVEDAAPRPRLSGERWRSVLSALRGRGRGFGPRERRGARMALIASLIAIAVYMFIALNGRITRTIQIEHIDLNVYRSAARILLDGGNLYGALPAAAPGINLPFTYPPIAALLLTPLAAMPDTLDGILAIAVTITLLVVVLRLIFRALGQSSRTVLNWSVLVALPTVLILDPVRVTLADGQIDVVLMALVVVDTLGSGIRVGNRQVRGVLLGLCAAVKLTPIVFVLYYLARGDRRSAATATASFAGFTALGALVAPSASNEFWGSLVFQTNRIGSSWYAANQSLQGALARFGLTGLGLTAAWLATSALVLVLGWSTMRRAAAMGRPVEVLLINALTELLISPISWTHHWVWIVPILIGLFAAARHGWPRWLRILTPIGLLLFAVGPQWLLPHGDDRELRWGLWEQIIGNSYVWFGLAVLIGAALVVRRGGSSAPRWTDRRFGAHNLAWRRGVRGDRSGAVQHGRTS